MHIVDLCVEFCLKVLYKIACIKLKYCRNSDWGEGGGGLGETQAYLEIFWFLKGMYTIDDIGKTAYTSI